MKLKAAALLLSAVTALSGCTSEAYDSGDGKYSYLTADFVVAHTSASKTVDYVVCDNGDKLYLSSAYRMEWAERADSTYRALLYYNAPKTSQSGNTVEAVAAAQVPVCRPIAASRLDSVVTDPLTVESAWLSANRRYVNLALLIKTGKADSDAEGQSLALVLDSIGTQTDGTRYAMTRLYHSQGGVPEYYTSRYYVSIDTQDFSADAISIEINTYDGKVTKTISF
jgi:hypothetical protein